MQRLLVVLVFQIEKVSSASPGATADVITDNKSTELSSPKLSPVILLPVNLQKKAWQLPRPVNPAYSWRLKCVHSS